MRHTGSLNLVLLATLPAIKAAKHEFVSERDLMGKDQVLVFAQKINHDVAVTPFIGECGTPRQLKCPKEDHLCILKTHVFSPSYV